MPNLPAHIDLAYKAAAKLSHPTLERNMGHFLLGSTSPDVRAITKGRREDYHFAQLDFGEVGEGVRGLFTAHPSLRLGSNGDGPTAAFVAGYLTHLVLDEVWIVELYRPCFGNVSVFQDEVRGKVLDRALQLELDRLSRAASTAAIPLLAEASDLIVVDFIPAETLSDWRDLVMDIVQREFTWDRLRFMARRIAEGDENHRAHRLAEEFLGDMPRSVERLYDYVKREELIAFRERAVESLVGTVAEYLE